MITIEVVLLMWLYAFVLFPALISSEYSPINVFKTSGSRLASRIEKDTTIGYEFTDESNTLRWAEPSER